MKKLLLPFIVLLFSSTVALNAQNQKRIEHVLEVGGGLSWNDDDTDRAGIAASVSYGMDVRLNNRFSVMPMIGYRVTSEGAIRSGWDGVSLNDFSFVDFSVSCRYRVFNGKTPIVVGLGPYISWIADRDKYSNNCYPYGSIEGKKKLIKADIGLMPSVSFDLTPNFSLGAKMNLSLIDTSEHYREIDFQEERYLVTAESFLRFRF